MEIKGISLPVNTFVVVIVALIVLASIIAYLILFPPPVACASYLELAYLKFRNAGCEIDGISGLTENDLIAFETIKGPVGGNCKLRDVIKDAGLTYEQFFKNSGCSE